MSADAESLTKANAALVFVIVALVLGVIFFRARSPVYTPEGMSMAGAMASLLLWYSLVVVMSLASVFYRLEYVATINGWLKHVSLLLVLITLAPVAFFVIVISENLT